MFGYLPCLIAWLIYLMSLLGSLITLLFLGFGDIRDTSNPLWLSLKAGVFQMPMVIIAVGSSQSNLAKAMKLALASVVELNTCK